MGNVYTTKDGLKKMEVEYGWGMEMEATYFPLELAIKGRDLAIEAISLGKEGVLGKLSGPSINMLLLYCTDVIENSKKGQDTYVLDGFMANQLEEMQNIAKIIKCKQKL